MEQEKSSQEPKTLKHKSISASKAIFKYVLSSVGGAILFIIVANPITQWWSGPTSYKVCLVGDFRPGQEGGRYIQEGFLEKGILSKFKVDGVPVEMEVRDDEGDPQVAVSISDELSGADDILLVVGHLSSTQTKAALPNYLRKAIPPIPVVLASETNPYLYPRRGNQSEVFPLLRIAPTDDRQAADAAAFAVKQGATTFWIIEDDENPVYSKYLASEFIRNVQDQRQNVIFWARKESVPSFETFRALKPSCVFFTGSASNALILIRQLRAFSKVGSIPMPMVLLTDSAVDQSLIQQGGADVEGVNAIYPWPASDFANGNEGFKTIGRDARNVVERLLEDVSKQYSTLRKERAWFTHWIRSTLRIHKTSDARDTAVAVVEQSFQTKKPYPLSTGGRIAKFSAETRNEQAKFHIWKIQDGKFKDTE